MSTYILSWSLPILKPTDASARAALSRCTRALTVLAAAFGVIGPSLLLATAASAYAGHALETDRLVLWQVRYLVPLAISTLVGFLAPFGMLIERLIAGPAFSESHRGGIVTRLIASMVPSSLFMAASMFQMLAAS